MKVLRADVLGLCFGVRDALDIVRRIEHPSDATIHGELVHNEIILTQLDERGFQMTKEQHRDQLPLTAEVVITAHGVSEAERRRLEAAGKRLIDTTCPLVRRVHAAARELAREGRHLIVVGRKSHIEVRGIVEDLTACDIVESVSDVRRYASDRLGAVCQTTTPPDVARQIEIAIRAQNPQADLRWIETICQPTRDRQVALDRLLTLVEAMVVVGGVHSNNTRQLVERCRKSHVPVCQVQSASDVDPGWFANFATVGLTAGTSTLDETIEEVYQVLRRLPEGVAHDSKLRECWSRQKSASERKPV